MSQHKHPHNNTHQKGISQHERDEFRQSMETKKKQHDKVQLYNGAPEYVAPAAPKPPPVVRQSAIESPNVPVRVNRTDGEQIEFYYADLAPQRWQKLKDGKYDHGRWELDLHGKTEDEAERRLGDFVGRVVKSGAECALIIHGKGKRSPEGAVLKPCVIRWLREHPAVQGMCSVKEKDGGSGALYVLFRLP